MAFCKETRACLITLSPSHRFLFCNRRLGIVVTSGRRDAWDHNFGWYYNISKKPFRSSQSYPNRICPLLSFGITDRSGELVPIEGVMMKTTEKWHSFYGAKFRRRDSRWWRGGLVKKMDGKKPIWRFIAKENDLWSTWGDDGNPYGNCPKIKNPWSWDKSPSTFYKKLQEDKTESAQARSKPRTFCIQNKCFAIELKRENSTTHPNPLLIFWSFPKIWILFEPTQKLLLFHQNSSQCLPYWLVVV